MSEQNILFWPEMEVQGDFTPCEPLATDLVTVAPDWPHGVRDHDEEESSGTPEGEFLSELAEEALSSWMKENRD